MRHASAESLGPAAASRRADRRLTLWTAGLLLATVLPQFLVAAVALGMREQFAFSNADLAAAVAVCFGGMAVTAPLVGTVVGRLGFRRAIVISTALVSAGSLATGLYAGSAGAVIALMAVIGLGGGIGSPTFSALLAAAVHPDRRGTAFGFYTAAPQTAAFVAGLALPLLAEPVGWRATFALPPAILAVCLAGLLRSGDLPVAAGDTRRRRARRRRPRPIHAIGFAAALMTGAGIGMRSFMVVFAVSAGADPAIAGLLLSATGLLAVGSRLGFGVLGDRRRGDALVRAAALMAVAAAGFALMASGAVALVVLGTLVAGGIGWGWQAPLSIAVIARHPHDTGAALGIQMSGFFAGAFAGPLLVGFAITHAGYGFSWWLCTLLSLAAAAVVLAVRRTAWR